MPWKKKTWRPKRKRRQVSIYGTKAKFMPNRLRRERYGQVSTKTFYFKASGTLNSNASRVTQAFWPTQFSPTVPTNPFTMPNVADSFIVAQAYTEYKVLSIKVRVFASNIGTEVGQLNSGVPPDPGFNRGDTVMYIDQDIKPTENRPTDILAVMNRGSCKMIPTRVSRYTKVMFRPKGYPKWGTCDRNVPVAERQPDQWFGAISLLGNNARIAVRPLWFFTVTYKIVFRGRNYDANVAPPPGFQTVSDLP